MKKYLDIEKVPIVYILLFLFIFSFGIRAMYINAGLFHMDTVGVAQAVERTFETKELHNPGYGRYGSVIVGLLFYIPFRLITGIESSEQILLWSDILFAALFVVAFFLMLQKMFKKNIVSLFSSLLLSVSPIFLSITTYGKQYGLELFFIVSSFLLLLYYQEQRACLLLVLSSISMAFAVLVRESALIYIPFYLLLYVNPEIYFRSGLLFLKKITIRKEVFKIKNLLCIFIPFIIIFGAHLYFGLYNVFRNLYFKGGLAAPSFSGFRFPFLSIALNQLYFNLSLLGILLMIAGVFISFVKYENKFHFFFLLFLFATFFITIDNRLYKARYLVVCSIPPFIFMAFMLESIYKRSKLIGLGLFTALIVYLFLEVAPILAFRHIFSGPKEYALWLKTKVPANSIIIAMDDIPFIEYYSKLKPIQHPINNPEATKKWIQQIKDYIRRGIPVYVVETSFSYDYDGIVLKAITDNFNLELIGSHPNEHYQWTVIESAVYNGHLSKLILNPE